MIDFIKLSDFEAYFETWKRGRTPNAEFVESYLVGNLERMAATIAKCLAAGETVPQQQRHIRYCRDAAVESAFWREYQAEYQIGPIQQQGTLVGVSHHWPGKREEVLAGGETP